MPLTSNTLEELLAENDRLRLRLEEAEATVEAHRNGRVDGAGAISSSKSIDAVDGAELRTLQTTEQTGNERVLALMESLTEGLCVLDLDYRFTYVNAAAERITGIGRDQLLGRTQWEVFPGCVGTVLEREFRRAMAERVTTEFENHYAPWDRWYALKAYPDSDGGICVLYRDITEPRRAADARQRAEERVQRVFDTQTVGMIEWNIDSGLITAANGQFLKMVGYSPEDVAAGRLDFRAMTPPEWTAHNEDRIALIRRSGRAPAYEKEYLRRDGTRVPILIAGVSFENSANEGMSVIVDLTDTKRAEADLRASEGRFRAAVGALSSIVWTNNPQGMMTGEQTSWANFTGQDRERYQGFGWSHAVHPDDAEATINAWNDAVARKTTFVFEHRVRRHDGQWRMCSIRAVPVLDILGSVAEWVGVHTDITEQRAAESVLKASETRYRRLFESAKDGILILDGHAATITDANPYIAEMMGYSRDQLVGKELWQIGLFKDVEASKSAMRKLQEKRYIRYENLPLETRAGRRINVEFVSNVYGEGGDTVIQCNVRDISDRKRLEESLRQRAADFSQADRRKDEFLATLAHELRNPLAPIRTGLQLLRLSPKADVAARTLPVMERQLGHLVRLIDDLLDVSRISSGKIVLKRERIAFHEIAAAALEASQPVIDAAGHSLTIDWPEAPVWLDADPTRMAQIFSNLLINSAKYMRAGGQIRFTALQQGENVVISVTDTGMGIPADMLSSVFDMFTQINRTLDVAQGGLGIGLSLVKTLVEMHGGSVKVESDGIDLGSTFTVVLPTAPTLAAVPPTVMTQRAETAVAGPVCHRILVVDDNVDAAETLVMLLELSGFDARTAFGGQQALDVAMTFRPDVVFLDIGLPDMTGYEVARTLLADPATASAKLIALTGWGSENDILKSKMAGFHAHLTKPIDPEAVDALLARLLPA